ncbi:hypothetical protein FQN60_014051 [Etheostoma spectabile]|uniref:Uncharacterized protein n=1 Tax=Etheostoma spectabile TaxID=54343 RepID=A0A5J5D7R5_9PERO|nr:hypothetical protein FQN60_014051 [Etheostoma spectabile]
MSNIELTRSINMAELRKLRRQFISYTKMHPTENSGHISNIPPSQWLVRAPLVIMLPQLMQGFPLPYGCNNKQLATDHPGGQFHGVVLVLVMAPITGNRAEHQRFHHLHGALLGAAEAAHNEFTFLKNEANSDLFGHYGGCVLSQPQSQQLYLCASAGITDLNVLHQMTGFLLLLLLLLPFITTWTLLLH